MLTHPMLMALIAQGKSVSGQLPCKIVDRPDQCRTLPGLDLDYVKPHDAADGRSSMV
jgi:hypothetical protein